MKIYKAILIEDCRAVKKQGDNATYKPFLKGKEVVGAIIDLALTPESRVTALETKDGWIIPTPFLNVVAQKETNEEDYIQDAEIIEDKASDKYKEMIDRIGALKGENNIIDRTLTKSNSIVKYGMYGALIGFIYAFARGKSKILFASVGAIGGGLIGNLYSKKQ